MKNLKKVLSLALAFAMVLGLCVGAMAATPDVTTLKDWADVTHKDAAQLLNAFNIMGGDDKGFRPADNVTRAEAVKMISVALWHGDDLKDLFKDSATTFTDVSSNDWFAGYVKYAATAEIIGGRNATTFDPKGNVTGYELLKMALTALGYRQADEGLIGAGWQTKAMILAMDKDLTAGVKITDWSKPINREDTAQVIANMILAPTVKYDKDGYISDSEKNFGELYLGLVKTTGTLVANAYGKTGTDGVATANAAKYNSVVKYVVKPTTSKPNPTSSDTAVIEVNTNSKLFDLGLPVTIYSNGKVGTDGKIAAKDVVSVALSGLPEVELAADYSNIVDEPTYVTTGSTTNKFSDSKYFDTNADGKIDFVHTVYYSNTTPVYGVIETKNLGTVYQTSPTAAWRDNYDVKTFTLSDLTSRGFTKVSNITAAKDDVIAYTSSTNAVGATVNVGVVLTPVTGKVTRVADVTGVGKVYYVDGTTGLCNRGDATDATGTTGVGFGVSGTFYCNSDDTIGYFKSDAPVAEKKVALLYDAGYIAPTTTEMGSTIATTMSVAAILSDGTKGTYTVTKIAKGAVKADNPNTQDNEAVPSSDVTLNSETIIKNTLGITTQGTASYLNKLNTTTATDADNNYVVEYTLNDKGEMTITKIENPGHSNAAQDTTTGVEVTTIPANEDVKAGNPTVKVGTGNAVALIAPETVTFIQTSKYEAGKSSEAWAVYTGSTASYKTKSEVSAVTKDYKGTGTKYVAYAIVTAGSKEDTTTTSTFFYVVANNGQVAVKNGTTPVYEVVYFDADANKVVTAQMAGTEAANIKAGKFYTTMSSEGVIDATTAIDFFDTTATTYKPGYITGYASNIIGLTGFGFVTANIPENQNPTDTSLPTSGFYTNAPTGSYAVTKDTKFYLIDGDKSEEIKADAVSVQGYVNPKIAYKDDTKDDHKYTVVTITYGAVVITGKDNTVATKVIVFAKDQTASQTYTTKDGRLVTE